MTSLLTSYAASTSAAARWSVSLQCCCCQSAQISQYSDTRRRRLHTGSGHGSRRSTFLPSRRLSTSPGTAQYSAPVSEQMLLKYSEQPPSYVSLKNLVQFGKPPISQEALIQSAEATRAELPHRLARRVLAHRSLPFIVGRNPFIAQVYNLYESSFATLSAVPPIKTLSDNEAFTRTLEGLVEDHANNVPILARGFSECKDYLSETQITTFFDKAIRNRIGIRLIAEQHLALSFLSDDSSHSPSSPNSKSPDMTVGIVDTACSLARIIKNCGYHVENLCDGAYGRAPELLIDGDTDAQFTYVPSHIEYVLNELLKNAFRATTESHPHLAHHDLPPVVATIAKSPSEPNITIRIRDCGKGIPPEVMPRVLDYAFTTVSPGQKTEGEGVDADGNDDLSGPYAAQNVSGGGPVHDELQGLQSHSGHLAGLGFGLPLSKLFTEYFGGSLELVSLYGHGTDAFVVLRGEEAAV